MKFSIKNMMSKKSAENKIPGKKGRLRENIEAIAIAIVLALFIRAFVVQAFKIPSGSMKQTLLIGDHILVNKFIYGVKIPYLRTTIIPIKKPKKGDVVVFKFPEDPEKDFIKRVVGIAGEMSTLVIVPSYKPAVAFAIMVLVLILRPSGIIRTKM